MDVRDVVERQMLLIATQQSKTLAPLSEDLSLQDCGLDSLCFAILVARLEDELGTDPFASADDIGFPTTFGEFVRLYERVPA